MKLTQLLEIWNELDPGYCYPERDGFWCGKEGQRLFVRSSDPEIFDWAALHFQVITAISDRRWNYSFKSESGICSAKVWMDTETTEFWVSKDPTEALLSAFVGTLQVVEPIAATSEMGGDR